MNKSQVLLLHPPITLKKQDVNSFGFYPPLGLAYLAGVLLQNSINTEIIDLLFEGANNIEPINDETVSIGLSTSKIKRILLDKNPIIVGISNNFTSFSADCIRLAKLVRECLPDAVVVMGGAHASMEPIQILESGYVNVVVIGEGEYIFRDLVSSIIHRNINSAQNIIGTIWSINGNIKDNGYREPIEELDKIPFPAYQLLPMDRYIRQKKANFAVVMRQPVGHIITTRGCPYNCIFCSTTKHFKKFRKRSPENIIQEMKQLISTYGIKEFHFHDDSFMADPNHVQTLCQMIIDNGIDIKWQVSQGINSARLDSDLLKLMHKSGMYRTGFPIESGCPETLKYIRKPIKLDKIKELIKECNSLGIYCFGCFMIGFPEETKEQLYETIDFIMNSGLDYVKINVTQPLKGSDLYNIYKDFSLIGDDPKESSTYFSSNYDTIHFKSDELNRLREEICHSFSKQRIKNMMTLNGIKRFVLPKLSSSEEILYFLKVGWLALRGY